MSVVKINAITVPAESGGELARRFAERVGAVDNQDGFEGFELLRPTDGRDVWLVVTHWRDDAAFEAWRTSASFAAGHQGVEGGGHPHAGQHGGGHPHAGGQHGGGHPGGQPAPLSTQSELWSYEVATRA